MSALHPQAPHGGPYDGPPNGHSPVLPGPQPPQPNGSGPGFHTDGLPQLPPAPAANGVPADQPPAAPASPYDFFMNDNQPEPAKGPLGQLPQSPGSQIALIAGGGLLIVIILGILAFALPKGDKKEYLISLNQQQVETLRLCTAGQNQAKQATLRGFAANCSLAMTTESQQLTAYLKEVNVKVDDKILKLGQNKKYDEALAKGTSSSNYDDAFKTVMTNQLAVQTRSIKQALSNASTTNTEKQKLTTFANATELLTKQLAETDSRAQGSNTVNTTGNTTGTGTSGNSSNSDTTPEEEPDATTNSRQTTGSGSSTNGSSGTNSTNTNSSNDD